MTLSGVIYCIKHALPPCMRRYSNIRLAFAMDTAYFRHVHGEKEFHVSFRFKNNNLGIDKQFNFCRKLEESCGDFTNRVNSNLLKLLEKKTKRKKASDSALGLPEVKSFLICDGKPLPDKAQCQEIFLTPNEYGMSILDLQWKIAINAPWIELITLPKVLMVGFPVRDCKFVHYFVAKNESLWTWYRSKSKAGPWSECGKGLSYTPNTMDINYYLRVVCLPKSSDGREGPPNEAISSTTVEAGPGLLPFESRHQFTKERVDATGFRVFSYNILADLYVDSEFAKTKLFGYCPTYALNLDYRKLLLEKELMGYNADIACFQEVDTKVFRHDLVPMFASAGLTGFYSQKGETVCEGTAIFYATDKFRSLKSYRTVLGEALKTESMFADIWQKIQVNEALATRVTQRSTTLQVILLESLLVPNEMLMVANTHLYFHPDADHIRLLQGVLITTYLQELLKNIALEFPQTHVSVLFCGDFNSTPECGIYQLLTTGSVGADHLDWRSNATEAISGVSFAHPLRIASACGTPDYTNYTPGFKACIDYIFYQTDRLEVKQVVPFPSEEELSTNSGIPSIVFPSDHIALISDIHWKT